MKDFVLTQTLIDGVYLIKSYYVEDKRGYFSKCFQKKKYEENGINFECEEVFFSYSCKNVIRGLHFQTENPQIKIISVLTGTVFDVVVDLRKKSPTQGKWLGFTISSDSRTALFIPKGCAHGFLSLCEGTIISYMCQEPYNVEMDTGIFYNDPDIGIKWPIEDINQVIVSDRDNNLISYKEFLDLYGGI